MGASGAHRGIEAPNVPREIMLACTTGDRIDVATYVALHTSIDIDGLFDLLELQEVHQSWSHAALRNNSEQHGR